MSDTISAFLAVTNRENDGGHNSLPTAAARVAETPGLPRRERDAARASCARREAWLPVLADFAWQRMRSPAAAVLVLLQVACKLVLQFYLPRVGLPSVPVCADAVQLYAEARPDAMSFSASDAALVDQFLPSSLDAYLAYLFFALMGLSRWNAPAWAVVGFVSALAAFILGCVAEAPFCFRLAGAPAQLISSPELGDLSGNYSPAVALYNLVRWGCTGAVAALLGVQAAAVVREWRGGVSPFWPALSSAAPPAGDEVRLLQGGEPKGGGFSFARSFRSVPQRHIVACLLSTLALLLLSINVASLLLDIFSFVHEVREFINDESWPGPGADAMDPVVLFVQLLRNVPGHDAVAGVLEDAVHYAPLGIWGVTSCLILAIAHSVYAVARQQHFIAARYAAAREALPVGAQAPVTPAPVAAAVTPREAASFQGAQKEGSAAAANAAAAARDAPDVGLKTSPYGVDVLGASVNEQLELSLAPDLRRFTLFNASQYIVAHLLTHLVVAMATSALVVVVSAAAVYALGGFGPLFSFLLLCFRAAAWSFAVTTAPPYLLLYVVAPLCKLFGTDAATVLRPFRDCYLACCACAAYSDGPHVLAPRALLAVDALLSATLGVVVGAADALTRFAMAITWGVLRSVVMHEPVVPRAVSSLDRPFMACKWGRGAGGTRFFTAPRAQAHQLS